MPTYTRNTTTFDRRTVTMDTLGRGTRVEVIGEGLSKFCNSVADSKDPEISARVDALLPPLVKGTKYESYERYRAAEKIAETDRPDLVAGAKAALNF